MEEDYDKGTQNASGTQVSVFQGCDIQNKNDEWIDGNMSKWKEWN